MRAARNHSSAAAAASLSKMPPRALLAAGAGHAGTPLPNGGAPAAAGAGYIAAAGALLVVPAALGKGHVGCTERGVACAGEACACDGTGAWWPPAACCCSVSMWLSARMALAALGRICASRCQHASASTLQHKGQVSAMRGGPPQHQHVMPMHGNGRGERHTNTHTHTHTHTRRGCIIPHADASSHATLPAVDALTPKSTLSLI